MRIDTLTYHNVETQGARRRAWLREHSPQHLQQCAALVHSALEKRPSGASQGTLVLGAGACTEIPLEELVRHSDEVALADLDLNSMKSAWEELPSPALRRRVRLLECDLTGGVSTDLHRLLTHQPWDVLIAQGARAVFDAAASCLELCSVADPPQLATLSAGEFGLVVSSLTLSQLFSYPLLDVLDYIQQLAPSYLNEQEHHHRYQQAAQDFRARIIQAHLHLLRELLDTGGLAVLLSDIRGFAFNVSGTEHRRSIPLVPRVFPELVSGTFTVLQEAHWEWITDLPAKDKFGRGYEVVGYVLNLP
ncbi:MAG TPA: hypothetical protein VFQ36_20915 [Ktedonobacteraceae bacterium]|nr:hypothetical protein [Ktedonobacteraceae bacterium]